MSRETPKPALDPAFFDGRFMIEIEEWNWALSVGLSHPLTPRR